MKTTSRKKLEAYYTDGASWADDRLNALRASRRIAWIIAAVAVVVALFEAVALIFLAPLKTVVPYTLMVDRTTGYVQVLKPLDGEQLTPDAALIQSFLVQYVIARESFAIDDVQNAYRKVTLWSQQDARADYIAMMQPSNPGSPLSRYPRSTVVETQVKSVSTLAPRTALVRFETRRRDPGGQLGAPAAWVAVIRYRFTNRALTTEDRFLNPLGFQVYSYRRSAEALPPPEPAVAGTAPTAGAAAPVVVVPPVVVAPGTVQRGTPGAGTSSPTAPRPTPRPTTPSGIEITL
ncbi:VirB8/TrbF family protein [uncultured Sphingomonas sp.]|uniref:virB8 family protein n=1 Tax=uncultured Sphingomonas sp. TaxID=158754 RepID=UPI0025FAD7F7|nr:VirB8/TrbF family protein [uncultured Sphingomonas sp.]